ncbi:MAG: hypothetical protein Q4F65_04290, partial [Propionibacteriaceae bacterium]|nr:hypothetical protein [Propionibacteriaceae bacterium]
MTNVDDEDWLYRRGRYSDDAGPAQQPPARASYGAPTPVGHYGSAPPPSGPPVQPRPPSRPASERPPAPPAPTRAPRRR